MTETVLIILSYLFGSASSAIIICRLMNLPDPRTVGSKNPGATNVLRLAGKKAAAITLFGDWIKGVIPIIIGHFLNVSPFVLGLTSLAVFIGHLYPVFFSFKGGKGVATALGVQVALYWPIGLTVACVWLVAALVFKVSSLASLTAMALAPLIVWIFWPDISLILIQLIISLFVFWTHRSNIRKLIAGTEDKITNQD